MTKLSLITRTRQQIIQIVIWIISCVFLLMCSLPFWQFFNWKTVSSTLQWQQIEANYMLQFIAAIVFLLVFCIGISVLGGLTIAFYFRKFQFKFRVVFLNVLMYLAYLPSLLLAFLVAPMLFSIFPELVYSKIIVGVILFFLSVFPFILFQLFKHINNIQQELIDVGYSLGANPIQIANGIILPKIKSGLLITIVLAVGRILLECVVVGLAVGIISFSAISYLFIILLIVALSLILFAINQTLR